MFGIYNASFSRLSRPYEGNQIYFLFLHLLICLNSADSRNRVHAKLKTKSFATILSCVDPIQNKPRRMNSSEAALSGLPNLDFFTRQWLTAIGTYRRMRRLVLNHNNTFNAPTRMPFQD